MLKLFKRMVRPGLIIGLLLGVLPLVGAQEGSIFLTSGIPVSAEISEAGENDTYYFTGTAGDRVVITAVPAEDSALDTVLTLYSPAGLQLAKNDDANLVAGDDHSEIEINLPDDGDYRVVVSGFGGQSTGAYEILLAAEGAPTPQMQGDLDLNEAVTDRLNPNRFHIWDFTPDENMDARLSLQSDDMDVVLSIFNSQGELLARNDDADDDSTDSLISRVALEAGETYQIRVNSFANRGRGAYTLLIEAAAPALAATPIAYGETLEGTVLRGEATRFEFVGAEGDTITVTVDGDFDSTLQLVNSAGDVLETDDDSGGNFQPLLYQIDLPADDTYQIVVTGYENLTAGDFSITLESGDAAPIIATDDASLLPGESISGFLDEGDSAVYTFTGDAGDVITLTVDASFDTRLDLYNAQDRLLISDDDSGFGLNPLIENFELPESGVYNVVLQGFSNRSSGRYTLTLIEEDAATINDDDIIREGSGRIAYGESVEGMVEGGEFDNYIFEGEAGDLLTITVDSGFDAVLIVESADGELIDMDDDSGGNLQPYLDRLELPDDGSYIIMIGGYSSNDGGDYTLTLTTAGTAPPDDDLSSREIASISYGETVEGELDNTASAHYQFEGEAGDVLTITVESDFDAVLIVESVDGDLIGYDDDSGGDLQPRLDRLEIPEDGAYIIAVSGYSSFDDGDYTLTLTIAGTGTATSPSTTTSGELTYGETITGNLAKGEDAAFEFTAEAGDVVTIQAASEFDGYLELYDPADERIMLDDDSGDGFNPLLENILLEDSGTYTVIFSSFGGQANGEFTISLTNGDATAIDPDQPGTGTSTTDTDLPALTFGDRVYGDLSVGGVQQFTLEADAGDQLSLIATPTRLDPDFDLFVEVYLPSGVLLAVNDDGGWRANPALVGLELPESGTYTIGIRSFDGLGAGEFLLALEAGAVYLAPDGTIAPTLDIEDEVNVELASGSLAAFVFTAETDDLLTVQTEGGAGVEVYSVEMGSDYPLALDVFTAPFSGAYMVVVFAPDEPGAVTLLPIAEAAIPSPPITTMMDAVLTDEPVLGSLQINETQVWAFTPLESGIYTFALQSEDPEGIYDPYLRLLDSSGNLIAADDDSGGAFNALIADVPLEAGKPIKIEVTSFAGQVGGAYTLAVVAESIETVADVEGGTLQLDQAASATLETFGQQVIFDLDIDSAGTYALAAASDGLPVIDVYNADGDLISRGTNRIPALKLEAGSYKVYVYNRLNQTGDIEVVITSVE